MEEAKLDFSIKRIVRKVLLEIQKSWIFPSRIRCKLLGWSGVNIQPSFVGTDVSFDTLRPELISIGDNCVITTGTKIISHFFNPEKHRMYYGPVVIGNNVFLGMNVLIVNSISIGDNAVVAAGSVVTKDIPAGEIWGGVPAKFIKKVKSL